MGKKKGTRTLRFKYNEDTMGNHKIFIWVWSAVLVVSYLACSSFWGYNAPSIPFSFLFVYIVYLWCRRWESKNEEAERTRALELMKERVVDDVIAKEKGIKEYQMFIDNRSYDYSMRFRRFNA